MRNYLGRLFCLLLSTLAIVLFWRNTILVTFLLVAMAVLINLKSKKYEVIYFVTVAVLATILESIAMSTGAWKYPEAHILNFPIWLPIYWGIGGLVMRDLAELIKRKVES
jgi:uncharacterized membrane protein YoaT (DUF817 family)